MGKFIIKEVKNGFIFNLKAGNGQVIATSEVYTSVASCKNGIDSVIKNAPIAPVEDQTTNDWEKISNPKFEVYKDKKDEFRFRLKAKNGEIIAAGEGYSSKNGCLNGIESIRENVANASIEKE